MKALIATLAFVMTATLCAHAEDMQKYLTDTQALVKSGEYEEALARFVWFHDHALEHNPAMYGVRLSFALSYWKQLGDAYPPALAALKQTRDDKTGVLEDGNGDRSLFHDVVALNRTLGDEDKTVELFRILDQTREGMATECWAMAQEAVISQKAYDLARKYMGNPEREFGKIKESYERNKALYADENFGEHFRAYNENRFVKDTLQLIEVALALGDAAAAREIQQRALAILDDYRLLDAPVEPGPGPAASANTLPEGIDPGQTSDDPTYGYTMENPVKLGSPDISDGPGMSRVYLRHLRDGNFKSFTFTRDGSFSGSPDGHILDRYTLVDGDGKKHQVYIDMYHPENPALDCKAPQGMYFWK